MNFAANIQRNIHMGKSFAISEYCCISLAVFCIIANIMFQGTHLHWNHILAFFLIICAVYLVFMDK